MVFEGPFPEQPTRAIATYDWETINTGTGYVTLYGFSTNPYGGGGLSYSLNEQLYYSTTIETNAGAVSANGEAIDLDFDLPFNRSVIIEGNLYAQFSIACNFDDATVLYGKVKVRKYNATDGESEIANGNSQSITNPGDTKTVIAKVVVPRTLFSAGDTLRITMAITVANYQGIPSTYCAFAHDPMGRDGTIIKPTTDASDTTIFKVNVPFKPML